MRFDNSILDLNASNNPANSRNNTGNGRYGGGSGSGAQSGKKTFTPETNPVHNNTGMAKIPSIADYYKQVNDAVDQRLRDYANELRSGHPTQSSPKPRVGKTTVIPFNFLGSDNTGFGKLQELLKPIDAGNAYAFRNGKWEVSDIRNMTDPDFSLGYSYKGNDIIKGRNKTSTEYKKYLDLVDTAKSDVKGVIDKEKANALMRGVKYDITPEDINRRTQTYFEKKWSQSNQDKLQSMIDEFGKPRGFKKFELKPGKNDQNKNNTEQHGSIQEVSNTMMHSGEKNNIIDPLGGIGDTLGSDLNKTLLGG